MNTQRLLFTGGGTAGHVIVNLALIPAFQKEGWDIDYIGSHDGIERKLVEPFENVTYYSISTGKLRRYLSAENIKDPFKVIKGVVQAWRIIGKKKPAVIFSKGGFVSVPVIMAAKLRGVPTVIHESDFTPGLANKLSIPFAQKILATFPETMDYLPEKKAEHVGAVVRDELFTGDKTKGFALCGFTSNKPVLLVMGGSGGAEKINQTVRESLDQLLSMFQIAHICGQGKTDPSFKQDGYAQFDYINEELPDLFAATDLVLSRAGSNAIFEFLALRKPMLLIPLSSSVSRGDQIINARSFKDQNFARVMEEGDLTDESLVSELSQLTKQAPVIVDHMESYQSDKARERVMSIIKQTGDVDI